MSCWRLLVGSCFVARAQEYGSPPPGPSSSTYRLVTALPLPPLLTSSMRSRLPFVCNALFSGYSRFGSRVCSYNSIWSRARVLASTLVPALTASIPSAFPIHIFAPERHLPASLSVDQRLYIYLSPSEGVGPVSSTMYHPSSFKHNAHPTRVSSMPTCLDVLSYLSRITSGGFLIRRT
ncbi:hypothetical protein BDN70DRAFT_998835 [Pholiota conissans]|uniref:Secreted protein n=1 Tax=Pholiota conissans TaxID=109636 RepID=A0A9P6CL62_9AGAR|nr:hypothetical protein BDN70DRAFT_998835 [Pholiota conissans]